MGTAMRGILADDGEPGVVPPQLQLNREGDHQPTLGGEPKAQRAIRPHGLKELALIAHHIISARSYAANR